MFRHVQYLMILENEAVQAALFFAVPAAVLVQAIVVTNTLRTPLTPENMIQFIVMIFLSFNCVSHTIMVYGGQANIFTSSESGMANIKTYLISLKGKSRKEVLWKRKFYSSCAVLKVKIGSVNFFDQLTPLVMIDQANDLTINFLLLGN